MQPLTKQQLNTWQGMCTISIQSYTNIGVLNVPRTEMFLLVDLAMFFSI